MKKKILISVLLCFLLLSVFCFSAFADNTLTSDVYAVPYATCYLKVTLVDGQSFSFLLPSPSYSVLGSYKDQFGFFDFWADSDKLYGVTVFVRAHVVSGYGYVIDYGIYPNAKTGYSPIAISSIEVISSRVTCPVSRPVFSYMPIQDRDSLDSVQSLSTTVVYSGSKRIFTAYSPEASPSADDSVYGVCSDSQVFTISKDRNPPAVMASDFIGLLIPDDHHSWNTDTSIYSTYVISSSVYPFGSRTYYRNSSYLNSFRGNISFNYTSDQEAIANQFGVVLRLDAYFIGENLDFGFIDSAETVTRLDSFWSSLFNDISAFFSIHLFSIGSLEVDFGTTFLVVFLFGLAFFIIKLLR